MPRKSQPVVDTKQMDQDYERAMVKAAVKLAFTVGAKSFWPPLEDQGQREKTLRELAGYGPDGHPTLMMLEQFLTDTAKHRALELALAAANAVIKKSGKLIFDELRSHMDSVALKEYTNKMQAWIRKYEAFKSGTRADPGRPPLYDIERDHHLLQLVESKAFLEAVFKPFLTLRKGQFAPAISSYDIWPNGFNHYPGWEIFTRHLGRARASIALMQLAHAVTYADGQATFKAYEYEATSEYTAFWIPHLELGLQETLGELNQRNRIPELQMKTVFDDIIGRRVYVPA